MIRARNLWSLLDQAWVSGINFLIGIVLARTLGLDGFGVYAVAQTYLLYANTFQASLVVAPMMTSVPLAEGVSAQRALLRGYFGCMLAVLVITVALVLATGWVLGIWLPAIGLHGLALPLGAAMAAFQLQDWLRRSLFTRDQLRLVLATDVLAYGGQIVLLLVLADRDALTPASAFWVLAATFAVSAVCTVATLRLLPSATQALAVLRAEWRASRDYFASWQLQWVSAAGVVLVGTSLVGVHAAGAIRAVQNLTGLITVFFQWMDNVVPVRCAVQLRTGGLPALLRFLAGVQVAGGLGLTAIGALLTVFAAPLLGWIYGSEYAVFGALVALQAAYYVLQHLYRMESYLRRTLMHSDLLAKGSLIGAVTAVAGVALLVPVFAEAGILVGMLAGQLAALLYMRKVRKADPTLTVSSNRPTHVVLSNLAGRGRLVLPAANRRVLQSTLQMYYPSRWAARVYRQLLALVLPPVVRLGLPLLVRPAGNWCTQSTAVAAMLPAGPRLHVGGLLGQGDEARAKTTLKYMTDRGDAVAYARVAESAAAAAALRNEATVLQAVAQTAAAQQSPALLAIGGAAHGAGYFLVESPGPLARAGTTLGQAEFDFLACLVTRERVPFAQALKSLKDDTLPLMQQQPLAAVLARALDALHRWSDHLVPRCIEHGDFVPWNIRRDPAGRIFVIDWEHARVDGLPWLDALHHSLQQRALLGGTQARSAVAAGLQVSSASTAARYAEAIAPCDLPAAAYLGTYLIRSLITGHRDGLGADFPLQSFRLHMLEVLLENHLAG